MEKKRIFRHDFIQKNNDLFFKEGEIATVLKEERPLIHIKVKAKKYTLPYRDFMITTKPFKLSANP